MVFGTEEGARRGGLFGNGDVGGWSHVGGVEKADAIGFEEIVDLMP
jgi:hypothetical protein